MPRLNQKQLMVARQEYNSYLAVGNVGFSKLNLNTPLDFFKKKGNTTFESLGCVGYNPEFEELTATVKIKRANGYSGNLCSKGSYEYVRFYLDYQDGNGWEDMGYVALNVHDIPTKKDCSQKAEKPIDYVVRLKIDPKQLFCNKANLPKVKAILSWNSIPAANDPNQVAGNYSWGDAKVENIQIKPIKLFFPTFPVATNFTLSSLSSKRAIPKKVDFLELAETYKKEKIEPHRFGYKLLKEAQSTTSNAIVKNITNLFASKNLSLAESMADLNKLNCNTTYEELLCVGADYNQEALVGTFKVKKPSGYSGNLCNKGSKEYVSFWIQEERTCKWIHAGTTFVEVHDINPLPKGGLSYSAILPYDFSKLKKRCTKPQVLKVRAILSWNTPPQGMDCSNWGNVVESYIQLKPRVTVIGNAPKMITVGGIATDNINPVTGLTVPGAKFEFNQIGTFNNSPFRGVIVIQGVSAPYAGQKYKVKITNLATNGSYYLNDDLKLIGFSGGTVTHPVVSAVGDEYTYQPYNNNIGSVLARFSPGTNDKIRVTIEHGNGTSDSQIIQMDSTLPKVTMSIDDGGNCTHYNQGDTIKGEFTVADNYLENYAITIGALGTYTRIGTGLDQSGTNTGAGKFEIQTNPNLNCGSIHLRATQKAILNSVTKGTRDDAHITVCLK